MNLRTSVRVHEAQKGKSRMKQTAMLTTASLLTILLMTFHLTGDILFKIAPAGLSNLFAVFIFVVLLCGTLLLAVGLNGATLRIAAVGFDAEVICVSDRLSTPTRLDLPLGDHHR